MIKNPNEPTFVAGQLGILPFLEILNLEIFSDKKTENYKYKVSVKPEDCGSNVIRTL